MLLTLENSYGYHQHGWTALHRAAMNGHEAMVRLLLGNGAQVTEDFWGATALTMAVTNGHVAIARAVLEYESTALESVVPGLRWTALHLAAATCQAKMVEILLENGSHIDAPDREGRTPLYLACTEYHVVHMSYRRTKKMLGPEKVVRALIQKGADVNAKCMGGWTALHLAASRDIDLVAVVIGEGADINAETDNGATALSIAALRGDLALVRMLVQKGADLEIRDIHGETALDVASTNGYDDMVLFLEEAGAGIKSRKPLRAKVSWEREDISTTQEGKLHIR
jgi:uncharacterized protein